jgi:hypothetical protein
MTSSSLESTNKKSKGTDQKNEKKVKMTEEERRVRNAERKSKAQRLFFIGVIIVFLILAPFTTETYKLLEDIKSRMPPGYKWPSVSDFWFTAVTAVVFWVLEHSFQTVLYPWFYKYCKEKNDLEIRDKRTRKAVNNIYKFFYYSFSTAFGWYVMKDSYFFPPCLGGKGSLYAQFTDFPYITPPPLFKIYFTGTMGYHIGSLLHHAFTQKKANDY